MEYYIRHAKEQLRGKAISTIIDLEIMAKHLAIEQYWIYEEFIKALNKEIKEKLKEQE